METKKQSTESLNRKRAGRNPFKNLFVAGASVIAGSAVINAVNKWRTEHQAKEDAEPKPDLEELLVKLDQQGENTSTEEQVTTTEEQDASIEQEGLNEPHPVDPANNSEPNPSQESEAVQSEVAGNMNGTSEIDSADGDIASLLKIGEPQTIYTENGPVEVFGMEINDPELEGVPFFIADTDGDGEYDSVLLADGAPADFQIQTPDGGVMSFDDLIASVHMTYNDLEEMHDITGGYLAPDQGHDMAKGDDPSIDIIDENGHAATTQNELAEGQTPENNEQLAQRELNNPDDDEDSDLKELLAQLLGNDDDDPEGEELVDEDDDDDAIYDYFHENDIDNFDDDTDNA